MHRTQLLPPIIVVIIFVIAFCINPFFTASISLTSELIILVVLALLICFMPLAYTSSELFGQLGVYHPLSKLNSPFGETRFKKLFDVYILNLELSFFISIVILFLVVTIIQFKEPITRLCRNPKWDL